MPLDPTQRYITSLAMKGDILAVGLADYRVELFNTHSLESLSVISEDLWEVKSVHLDDKLLLISSLNESALVYDLADLVLIGSIHHPLGILKMWTDNEFIYTTSYNQEVRLWDRTTFEHKFTLPNHSVRSNCVISTDKFIYTGDGFTLPNASIRIWDRKSKNLIKTLESVSCKRVNHIQIIDNLIISAHGSPGGIQIRDLHSHELVTTLPTGSDCSFISINDTHIVGAAGDTIHIWDRGYQLLDTINENGREVSSGLIVNNKIVYGSRNTLKTYNLDKLEVETQIEL